MFDENSSGDGSDAADAGQVCNLSRWTAGPRKQMKTKVAQRAFGANAVET